MIVGGEDTTGNLTAANQAVTLTCVDVTDVAFQLSGTFSGTVTFEVSNDEAAAPTNWFAVGALASSATALTTAATTATAGGIYRIDVAPYKRVRARCSAYTSGTIVVRATKVMRTGR